MITLIWNRLAQHKVGAAGMVPTLWIVLGPVGQSITAVNLLASNAPPSSMPQPPTHAGRGAGVRVRDARLRTAVDRHRLTITLRTAREHLPFSLTWWSFTFPVGTCVTGLNGLALHSGLTVVAVLAVVYYAGLVAAWITVAVRTLHGSVIRGTLLAPPRSRDGPDADQFCEQPHGATKIHDRVSVADRRADSIMPPIEEDAEDLVGRADVLLGLPCWCWFPA